MSEIQGGTNLEFLIENFTWDKCEVPYEQWEEHGFHKEGFVLEGGSGSGKTYDALQFIILYCQHNANRNKRVMIYRQKYSDCRETVLEDFIKILREKDLYREKNHTQSHPQRYQLFGNTIRFAGLDTMGAHGKRNDLTYGNEVMEMDKRSCKQINQRTNECFIYDYNPSQTEHWVYDEIIPRPDVKFHHSTLLNNPFLPPGQRMEILAYKPTPENIKNGTADEYLWAVYGLGLRSAPEGLIFQHVHWVDEFPALDKVYYGLDFGYTESPSTLVRIGIMNAEPKKRLYIDPLFYQPTPSPNELIPLIEKSVGKDVTIWADPSGETGGKGMISALRREGFRVLAYNPFPGAVKFGISVLKKYDLYLIDKPEMRKEQQNYKKKVVKVGGHQITLDEPDDNWNHIWDGARMPAIMHRL